MNIEDYQDLFQIDASLLKYFDFYKQTIELYTRTKIALGKVPTYNISYSNAKEAKIINGSNFSTKIYTSK